MYRRHRCDIEIAAISIHGGLKFIMRIAVSASATIPDDAGGRLLLARRGLSKSIDPGLWETIGGKLESGESPESCLERELREEVGCGCAREISRASQSPTEAAPEKTIRISPKSIKSHRRRLGLSSSSNGEAPTDPAIHIGDGNDRRLARGNRDHIRVVKYFKDWQ